MVVNNSGCCVAIRGTALKIFVKSNLAKKFPASTPWVCPIVYASNKMPNKKKQSATRFTKNALVAALAALGFLNQKLNQAWQLVVFGFFLKIVLIF
jgi:hypothetical protein